MPIAAACAGRGGESAIAGLEMSGGQLWHVLADPVEIAGTVEVAVDAEFRQMMRELHTDTHILNALVFQKFDGALVTGVQMNEDGTARMDFDLPKPTTTGCARWKRRSTT